MNGQAIASAAVAHAGPPGLAADPPGAAGPAHIARVGVDARGAGAAAEAWIIRATRP